MIINMPEHAAEPRDVEEQSAAQTLTSPRAGVCNKLHQIASGEEPAKEAAGHAAVQLHVEGNGLKALVHPDITKETFESHRAIVNYLAV